MVVGEAISLPPPEKPMLSVILADLREADSLPYGEAVWLILSNLKSANSRKPSKTLTKCVIAFFSKMWYHKDTGKKHPRGFHERKILR